MSIQLKAKLFRYKEVLGVLPLAFKIWVLAGVIWIVCGIIDLRAASRCEPYFRIAMRDVFHNQDPGLRAMQKAARQAGVIFIIAGILLAALQIGILAAIAAGRLG